MDIKESIKSHQRLFIIESLMRGWAVTVVEGVTLDKVSFYDSLAAALAAHTGEDVDGDPLVGLPKEWREVLGPKGRDAVVVHEWWPDKAAKRKKHKGIDPGWFRGGLF